MNDDDVATSGAEQTAADDAAPGDGSASVHATSTGTEASTAPSSVAGATMRALSALRRTATPAEPAAAEPATAEPAAAEPEATAAEPAATVTEPAATEPEATAAEPDDGGLDDIAVADAIPEAEADPFARRPDVDVANLPADSAADLPADLPADPAVVTSESTALPSTDTGTGTDTDTPRPRLAVRVTATLAAAGLVFALVAGFLWWRADHDPNRSAAQARDAAALAARLDITAVTSSDYRNAQGYIDAALSHTAGKLHADYASRGQAAVPALKAAKRIVTSTILDVAITRLDVKKGTASGIAAVSIRQRSDTGASSPPASTRFVLDLDRVDGQWKLTTLDEAAA